MILKFFREQSKHRSSNCETHYCTHESYIFFENDLNITSAMFLIMFYIVTTIV